MKTNAQKKSKPQNLMLYIRLFDILICYAAIFFILATQNEYPADVYVLFGSLFLGLSIFASIKMEKTYNDLILVQQLLMTQVFTLTDQVLILSKQVSEKDS